MICFSEDLVITLFSTMMMKSFREQIIPLHSADFDISMALLRHLSRTNPIRELRTWSINLTDFHEVWLDSDDNQ